MTKILVIEDELEIRANLLELLTLEGYDVIGADNGVTGLVGALEQSPDLILCDVMMPELNGYDVLSALRQEPSTAVVPFIFLTALADKGDMRQGMNLGADDYITKPFSCSDVIIAIKSRLEKQNVVEEHHSKEHRKAVDVQQRVQQFRNELNSEQAALFAEMRTQLKESLGKLSQTNQILKTLPAGEQRERSIAVLQKVCADKVKMLAKIPNFDYLDEDVFEKDTHASATSEDVLPHYTAEELAVTGV
ncbi:MAG: response regulator [Cyanobacteria bacterium J06555_13]